MTEITLGYYAARAVAYSEAEKLFSGNSSKNEEKRKKYVDDNWNKFHSIILKKLEEWKKKNNY